MTTLPRYSFSPGKPRTPGAAMTGVMGRRVALVLLAGLSLAACGRKGELEPPLDPAAVQKVDASGNVVTSPASTRSKRHAPFEVPKNGFFLDPLL